MRLSWMAGAVIAIATGGAAAAFGDENYASGLHPVSETR